MSMNCDHEEYEPDCEECMKSARRSALEAGIPESVFDGKTKLRDHFSQEYIDLMCGRVQENEDENTP